MPSDRISQNVGSKKFSSTQSLINDTKFQNRILTLMAKRLANKSTKTATKLTQQKQRYNHELTSHLRVHFFKTCFPILDFLDLLIRILIFSFYYTKIVQRTQDFAMRCWKLFVSYKAAAASIADYAELHSCGNVSHGLYVYNVRR